MEKKSKKKKFTSVNYFSLWLAQMQHTRQRSNFPRRSACLKCLFYLHSLKSSLMLIFPIFASKLINSLVFYWVNIPSNVFITNWAAYRRKIRHSYRPARSPIGFVTYLLGWPPALKTTSLDRGVYSLFSRISDWKSALGSCTEHQLGRFWGSYVDVMYIFESCFADFSDFL